MNKTSDEPMWPWALIALYVLSPLALHPIIFGNDPRGMGMIGFAFICYILVTPMIIAVFGMICAFAFLAVTLVEDKLLPEKLDPKIKRILAILIGVPLGVLLAWIGLSGEAPYDGIWHR